MSQDERARLVDVAARAGVTISTASRALARPEMVRPETRARVELAAAELGYHPNRAARSLITGRTGVIAIIVPNLANAYFALIAKAAQSFARERGYEVFIADTEVDPETEYEIVHSISRWVDGLIICAAAADHRPFRDVPIVYVNNLVHGAHAVVLDQRCIVESQLHHLLDLGHEQILWMSGVKGYWTSEMRRSVATRLAVEHPGIRIAEPVSVDASAGVETVDLLDPEITAVVAYTDQQALGLLGRCNELGIRVPEDLSVVGSDDVPIADLVGLTTMHAPKEAIGRAAVSLLLDHLTNEGPVIVETLRGHLIPRRSSGPPRPAHQPLEVRA